MSVVKEMGPVALQASKASLVTSATSCCPLANVKTRKPFKKGRINYGSFI